MYLPHPRGLWSCQRQWLRGYGNDRNTVTEFIFVCFFIYIHLPPLVFHTPCYHQIEPPFALAEIQGFKVLETFVRELGPNWYQSIIQLLKKLSIHDLMSHSTTCGSHLNTVNSLSCSRSQFNDLSLWHGPLSCWKQQKYSGMLSCY